MAKVTAPRPEVYRDVVEDQAELVIRWRPDGTIFLANEAYCRLLGKGREEILGESFFRGVPEEGRQHIQEEVDKLRSSRPFWTSSSPVPHGDSILWIEWSNRGLFHDSGELVAIQSVGRDITAQRVREEGLRDREAWFRALIDNAPEAITLTDGETGKLVSFNDRTLALLGRTREELAGVRPFDLSPEFQPDGRTSEEAGWDYVQKAMAGETPVFEWVHTRGDGTEGLFELRLTKLPIPGQSLIRASLVDLTDWKKAEKELRLTQAAMDQIREGVVVVGKDAHLTHANPAACELLGFTREEMLSRTIGDFDPRYPIEDWEEFWALVRVEGSQTVVANLRRKDGGSVPAEILVSHVEFDGRDHAVCTVRDLSARRKAEAAVQAREAKLESIFRAAPVGIGLTQDRVIREVNEEFCRMVGYERGELLGNSSRLLYSSDEEHERVGRVKYEAIQSTGTGTVETRIRQKTGEEIDVILSCTPLDPENPRAGVTFTALEVTESRKLQAQLRQAQKMEAVGQLTGGIAHDFNNLLSVILLHSELLRDVLAGRDPVLASAVEGISDAAEKAAEMTTQLLGFSRQATLSFVPTDLSKLVRARSSLLQRLIPETISVRILAEGNSVPVKADAGAIEQMLLNLATNARDAMPDGGTLEIRVGERVVDEAYCAERPWAVPGSYVCLSVSDTGHGMDNETKSRIFEPFFTTKCVGEGTGLGMAMVYGLTKQHKGFVDVETEPGEGTSITLCFPVFGKPLRAPTSRGEEEEIPGGNETILLVEDEEMLRHVGKGVLRQHGYRVLVAADGQEALEMLGTHAEEIDLVVSDIVMPQLGGLELCQVLNGSDRTSRILLTSGYPGVGPSGVTELDPNVPFIEKPWKAGDFLRMVREVLDDA